MAFDPDQYLKTNPGGFDPDKYLSASEAPTGPTTGAGEAALEHYGNAATMGYLPHLQAGLEPITDRLFNAITGGDVDPKANDYLKSRDSNLKRLALEGKEHPIASGAGSIGGIVASAALLPAGKLAKGASLATKALQGAKMGAAYGALANPGDVEGEIDPLQAGKRAKGAAIGGVIGGSVPIVLEGASKGASAVKDYLRNKAALKATRALGRPAPVQATRMAETGQDVALGRDLLDQGAIPVLGTPKRIAGRVDALKEKVGQEIGDLVDSGGSQKLVDAEKLGLDILGSPELAQMRKTPGMESTVSAIEKQVETLANNKMMTLKEAQKLRQGIDKSINFNKAAPEMRGAQEGLYQQRTAVRDAMNDAINTLNPGKTADALKTANRRYGNMSEASDILEREIGRQQANRAISLTDTIAGAAGAASGSTPAALALGAVNKFGRTFGNSIQARVYDAIAKKAGKAPAALEALGGVNAPALAASVRGANSSVERDSDPVLNDPRLMEIFRKDPSLIESIGDERVRSKVKRAIAGH